MKNKPSNFGEHLKQLVGQMVEVLLKNKKTIYGKLLNVESESLNVVIESSEGTFVIHGDSVVAIKREVSP